MSARHLLALLVGAVVVALPAGAVERKLPFLPGEKLLYDVSWSHFLTAGVGEISVSEGKPVDGRSTYDIEMIGRSIGFVDALYTVRDVTRGSLDIERMRGVESVIHIHENTYRKVKRIRFDREKSVAMYRIDDDPEEEFPIKPDTQGPISTLFVVRTMRDRLTPGATFSISLFDDKILYDLQLKVLRKETLDIEAGKVDTIVVEADLKTEGVFRRRGKLVVWFSDDEAMAPVQMRSKLVIGSFFVTLRRWVNAPIKVTLHDNETQRAPGSADR
jgi:hypothetical protein